MLDRDALPAKDEQTLAFAPRAWFDAHLAPIEAKWDELDVTQRLLYLLVRATVEAKDLAFIQLSKESRRVPGVYLPKHG